MQIFFPSKIGTGLSPALLYSSFTYTLIFCLCDVVCVHKPGVFSFKIRRIHICALLTWNSNLRAGYWQICIDPCFRQHWGSLEAPDCSMCGGLNSFSQLTSCLQQYLWGLRSLDRWKAQGGSRTLLLLLQVFHFSLGKSQSGGTGEQEHLLMYSKQ